MHPMDPRAADEEIIQVMARAMGAADHVWYWKDGYPDQDRVKAFYEQAARRQFAAHRAMTEHSTN